MERGEVIIPENLIGKDVWLAKGKYVMDENLSTKDAEYCIDQGIPLVLRREQGKKAKKANKDKE